MGKDAIMLEVENQIINTQLKTSFLGIFIPNWLISETIGLKIMDEWQSEIISNAQCTRSSIGSGTFTAFLTIYVNKYKSILSFSFKLFHLILLSPTFWSNFILSANEFPFIAFWCLNFYFVVLLQIYPNSKCVMVYI